MTFGTRVPKSFAHVRCSWALNIVPETAASSSEGRPLGRGGGLGLGGTAATSVHAVADGASLLGSHDLCERLCPNLLFLQGHRSCRGRATYKLIVSEDPVSNGVAF